MAREVRVAALLTGTLVLHVTAQQWPDFPYNFRSTYFMDGSCTPSAAFLIHEYYFPKINQCVQRPYYPPPQLFESMYPTAGKALRVLSCSPTAAVVSTCDDTTCGGSCTNQTVSQMMCMPRPGGRSQMVNFTCTMKQSDQTLLSDSTGRPASPCFAAQVDITQKLCDYPGEVCDPTSPCNQSYSTMWATCPGSAGVMIAAEDQVFSISELQRGVQMQCTPCTEAYTRVVSLPYCDIFGGAGMCYTDCVQSASATLQLCSGTSPSWMSGESGFAGFSSQLTSFLAKCASGTMPPPPPSPTASITFTYFKGGSDSNCGADDAWPGATKVNATYSIGQNMCVPGPWTPTRPAGSYQLRFDACNGERIILAECDANCVCGYPMWIPKGWSGSETGDACVDMFSYKQRVTWDRCPVPTLPPSTTTMMTTARPPSSTTMMAPPPATSPPSNTTMMPRPTTSPPTPPVFVSGSMTVKAATQDAANALVADPQVKTAFATGIGTIAGVDPSLVMVTLSVGARRLGASAAAPPRRLDASILVAYIISLPANGGTGPGGAPLPSPDAVKTVLTSATPAIVQATVTAAYATMKVTPPAFIVDTVTAPTVMVPATTTTTAVGRIGTAGGAEWGARAWLAGLLAVLASARCGF